jgi:hypothetical protein
MAVLLALACEREFREVVIQDQIDVGAHDAIANRPTGDDCLDWLLAEPVLSGAREKLLPADKRDLEFDCIQGSKVAPDTTHPIDRCVTGVVRQLSQVFRSAGLDAFEQCLARLSTLGLNAQGLAR